MRLVPPIVLLMMHLRALILILSSSIGAILSTSSCPSENFCQQSAPSLVLCGGFLFDHGHLLFVTPQIAPAGRQAGGWSTKRMTTGAST